MSSPRIYVASLSDYNAGTLLGRWIDASSDVDTMQAEVDAMLATSKEAPAEEWAIHDSECFGPLSVNEYTPLSDIARWMELYEEHGDLAFHVIAHTGQKYVDQAETLLTDGYRGAWDSLADYAEELITDCYDLSKCPDIILGHIDWKGIARDLEIGGDIFTLEVDGKEHVFDGNV